MGYSGKLTISPLAAIKRLFEDCTIFSTDSERSGTQLSKLEPRSGNEVEHTVGQEIRQVP